jgi:hypothetical protein
LPQVAIVGERNSGKTTFLGLLYAAQVKFGSDRADDFRFHAAFESLDEISGVFQRLMSGAFPDSATKEGVREVTFRLAPRKPRLGIFARRRSEDGASDDSRSFRLVLLKSFEDDLSRPAGGSIGHTTLSEALVSDAVVVTVDATRLAVSDEDAPAEPYDRAVESLLSLIQHSRAHATDIVLHPIFVFTKFDRVDPKALHVTHLEAEPPEVGKRGARAAYGKALVNRNMPKTIATIEARRERGLRFGTPTYFFSWVRTDPTTAGQGEKIRIRHSGAVGWEPDFSSDEYLAFLACLGELAPAVRR